MHLIAATGMENDFKGEENDVTRNLCIPKILQYMSKSCPQILQETYREKANHTKKLFSRSVDEAGSLSERDILVPFAFIGSRVLRGPKR